MAEKVVDPKSLTNKLSMIQSKLFVPKGQKNEYGNYNYRSCEDILVAVKPLLEENKCVLTLGDAIPVEIGGRVYIKVDVKLYDIEGGTSITITAHAREDEQKKLMDGSQITGSSISYARKYALASLFCIDNEKDADATNKHGKDEKPAETPKKPAADKNNNLINKTQIQAIKAELERTGVNESVILDAVKKSKLEEMTQAEYVKIIARLNNTSDKE